MQDKKKGNAVIKRITAYVLVAVLCLGMVPGTNVSLFADEIEPGQTNAAVSDTETAEGEAGESGPADEGAESGGAQTIEAADNRFDAIVPASGDTDHITISQGGTVYDDGETISDWVWNSGKAVTVTVSGIGSENEVTGNVLRITVPEGMTITNYPGKDGNMPEALAAFASVKTHPASTTIGGVTALYGTIEYNISDLAASIPFEIIIQPDQNRYYGPHTVNDVVKAELVNNLTPAAEPETVTVNAALTGAVTFSSSSTNSVSEQYVKMDAEVSTAGLSAYITKPSVTDSTVYAKEYTLSITYPAQAKLIGVTSSVATNGNDSAVYNGVKGISHDEESRTLTFYYQNVRINSPSVSLKLQFREDLGAQQGSSYKLTKAYYEAVMYDGTKKEHTSNSPGYTITIVEDSDVLELFTGSGTVAPVPVPGLTAGQPLEGLTAVSRIRFSNSQGIQLDDQIVEYEFPEELNIRGFDLPAGSNLSTTVNYRTTGGEVRSANITGTVNNRKVRVSPGMLGLQAGETLAWIQANCGSFPASYHQATSTSEGCVMFGNLYTEYQDAGPFQMKHRIYAEGTEKPAYKTATISTGQAQNTITMTGYASMLNDRTNGKVYTSGDTVPVWGTLNNYSGIYHGTIQRMKNPVIYVLIPEGMSVDRDKISITQGGTAVSFTSEETVRSGQKVVIIRTSNCIIGQMKDDLTGYGALTFYYEYTTSKSITSGSFALNDLIMTGPDEKEVYDHKSTMRIASATLSYVKADIYDLNFNERNENLGVISTTQTFSLVQSAAVAIDAKIKLTSEDDSAYRTYDGTEGSKVIFTPGSNADYLVTLDNRTAYAADELVAYIPVPKGGKDFGDNFQEEEFKWDMALKQAAGLSGMEADKFEVAYSTDADADNYQTTATYLSSAVWPEVTMIKISLKTDEVLSAGESVKVKLVYDIDVTDEDAGSLTGEENIFRPYFRVSYRDINGWFHGERVAAKLQIAEISGFVFVDQDKNGEYSAALGDTAYTGEDITIKITDAPNAGDIGRVTTPDQNGYYAFTGLTSGTYDIEFVKATLPGGYVFTKQLNDISFYRNSDAARTDGSVTGIDVSTEASRYIWAGIAENQAPVITAADKEINVGDIYTPSAVINDDFDGPIPFDKAVHVKENGVNTEQAGTYEVIYEAQDSDGKTGTAAQKVKVNGLPYLVSAPDIIKPVADAPDMAGLREQVNISYLKASETVGAEPVLTRITASITNPAEAPSTVGRYAISYTGGTPAVTGTYQLTLMGPPPVSAVYGGITNYVSGTKVNQNVTITAGSAPGFTLQYSDDDGQSWKNYPAGNVLASTDDSLQQTYLFRYQEIPDLDASYISEFQVDINKVPPLMLDGGDIEIAAGAVFHDKFTPSFKANVDGDSLTVTYEMDGEARGDYIADTQLGYGAYEFTVTDGYNNTSTYIFTIEPRVFTVTFDGDGADKEADPASVAYTEPDTAVTILPADPEKKGYIFGGWFAEKDGQGVEFKIGDTVTGSKTVYAYWKSYSYTVRFDVNGGDSADPLNRVVASPDTTVQEAGGMPAEPDKAGHNFAGWFDTAAQTGGTELTGNTTITGDITVYARWEKDTTTLYDVKFHMNDGTDVVYETVKRIYGDAVSAPAAPGRSGYIFAGWYKEADGNTKWEFDVDVVKGATDLYAKWNSYSYTVEFDVNGGDSDDPDNITVATPHTTVNEAGGMPSDPEKAGYHFRGWYTAENNGAEFTGDTAVTGDITVYAVWEKDTTTLYEVKFHLNDGSRNVYDTEHKIYGEAVSKPAQDPERSGYIFAGWYKEADGNTQWNFESDVIKGATNLYAKWTGYSYTVEFDVNGGDSANPTDITVATPYTTVNEAGGMPSDPEKAGYHFRGWYTAVNNGAEFTGDTTVTGDITVYAVWEKDTTTLYDVKFHLNDGSKSVYETVQTIYGAAVSKPAVDPERSGYLFGGWYKEAECRNVWDFDADRISGNTDLYAKWNSYSYTVKFDHSGGEGNPPSDITITSPATTVDEAGTMPADPTRTGYKFLGWFTQRNGGELFYGDTVVTKDITVYAQWTDQRSFVVTFHGNGATVQANPQVMTVQHPGNTISALPSQPARTGYTFNGWNTVRDGSGTKFNANTAVHSDITVYAQWAPVYYKLSFDLNGGNSAAPRTQSLVYGQLAAGVARPTRTGSAFLHWNTARDGSGRQWNFTVITMPAADVTLYAQWRDEPVTPGPGPEPDKPGSGNNNGGTTGGRTGTDNTGSDTKTADAATAAQDSTRSPGNSSSTDSGSSREEIVHEPKDAGVPTLSTGDGEVPLYGLPGLARWALINLILAIGGGVLAVCVTAASFMKRRREEDGPDDESRENPEDGQSTIKKRPAWLILTVVMGITGIVVFILTQNITGAMVLADNWTILMLIIMAVEIASVVMGNRNRGKDEDMSEFYKREV